MFLFFFSSGEDKPDGHCSPENPSTREQPPAIPIPSQREKRATRPPKKKFQKAGLYSDVYKTEEWVLRKSLWKWIPPPCPIHTTTYFSSVQLVSCLDILLFPYRLSQPPESASAAKEGEAGVHTGGTWLWVISSSYTCWWVFLLCAPSMTSLLVIDQETGQMYLSLYETQQACFWQNILIFK